MILFFWNLLLALTWAVATGMFSLGNMIIGFTLGYAILLFLRPVVGPSKYYGKVFQVVRFGLFYLKQLVTSNLRLAYDVATPTHHMRPGIVAVPLTADTDAEITLLANLITLTPGTLSLDLSNDRRRLYVHFMYMVKDAEHSAEQIKMLERRVLEVLR